MAKVSKAELKLQKEVQQKLDNLVNVEHHHLKVNDINFIYENYNPSMDDNVTERGVFFTPIGLCQDFNVFTPKQGHVVDVCSGIGGLSAMFLQYAYYHPHVESLTLMEFSLVFMDKAKSMICHLSAYNEDRRVVQINYIVGDAYLKSTWEQALSLLPLSANGKFDLMISNPPYGKLPSENKVKYQDHLKYTGERELMAVELCLKYAKHGQFIIPPGSCDKQFSGRPYLDNRPSNKLDRFRKVIGEEHFFQFEIDGIDTAFYKEEWKGTNILTEVVSINLNRKDYE